MLGITLASALPAQEPPVLAQPPAASRPIIDTAVAPVAPLPAFFRSLVLPGWGQAVLDRKLTGGLFLLWEGITLGMVVKTHREVQFIRATEDTRAIPVGQRESFRLRAKRAEREDWLVLLIFNHLFSGLEAYVGAHLWDFPADLRLGAVPLDGGRRPGVGVSLPFRFP